MTTIATATSKRRATTGGERREGALKGLVLSGGKGNRLRPFTYTNAKQLVPIANRPVLFYAIDQLVECGVTDIGIVVGDTADQVQAAAGDGSAFGANITYIKQDQPLGIAHAVKVARDFLGESAFVVYLGDNFVLGGIQPFVETFRANRAAAQILLHPVPNPESFGIARLVDGHIENVIEKPERPPSNLAVVGVYMLDLNVFDVIDRQRPSGRGELEITDALQGLIDGGWRVDAEVLDRYWIDTGKMDDILSANRIVLGTLTSRIDGDVDARSKVEGAVMVAAGARATNSRLRGPLIVGRGTQIIDSDIGPGTSIDHDCLIKNCRIEDSIIMDNTRIEDIPWPVVGSLIGRHVELRGAEAHESGYRLTLGDHSRIEVPDG